MATPWPARWRWPAPGSTGFAAARGHEHQRVAARHHMRHDGLLRATEALVAEDVFQDGMRGDKRMLLNV